MWRNEAGFGSVIAWVTAIGTLGALGLAPACTRTDTRGHDAAPASSAGTHALEATSAEATPAEATPVAPAPVAPVPAKAKERAAPASATSPCVVPSPAEAPPPAAPAASCPPDPTGPPELAWGAVTFVDAPDRPRIRIELAESNETRARGLMYRTRLEQDQGMLFVFPDEQRRSFWMKNTCIPLDMLFVDRHGTIVGIRENVPTLNLASRGVPCPAAYVLEVNAGWTREHGVFAGQRLEIER